MVGEVFFLRYMSIVEFEIDGSDLICAPISICTGYVPNKKSRFTLLFHIKKSCRKKLQEKYNIQGEKFYNVKETALGSRIRQVIKAFFTYLNPI
jgi:hypothetical protein